MQPGGVSMRCSRAEDESCMREGGFLHGIRLRSGQPRPRRRALFALLGAALLRLARAG